MPRDSSRIKVRNQFIISVILIAILIGVYLFSYFIGSSRDATPLNLGTLIGAIFITILLAVIVNISIAYWKTKKESKSEKKSTISPSENVFYPRADLEKKPLNIKHKLPIKIAKTSDINVIIVKNPPKNQVCMISKLQFDNQDFVVRCPACGAYFISTYLINWLEEKDYCPVCKFKLKSNN